MKKYQVLSLVVGVAMVFSIAGSGCKKTEQQTEAPKPAEQAQTQPLAQIAVEKFKVFGGKFEKGGIGAVLTAEKDKGATALKKTERSFKNVVKIIGQIKSSESSGVRNGAIVFGENSKKMANAAILMGAGVIDLHGAFIDKVQKAYKADAGKVFDVELTINIKEGTVVWKVDNNEITAKMTSKLASIDYIGYNAWSTKTEFSGLEISGD